jgi:hypothetical protein
MEKIGFFVLVSLTIAVLHEVRKTRRLIMTKLEQITALEQQEGVTIGQIGTAVTALVPEVQTIGTGVASAVKKLKDLQDAGIIPDAQADIIIGDLTAHVASLGTIGDSLAIVGTALAGVQASLPADAPDSATAAPAAGV